VEFIAKMSQLYFKTILSSVIVLFGIIDLFYVNCITVDKFLSLSLSQKNTLDQFRAQVQPLLIDDCMKLDTYLIRWLRARNFDLNAAEMMLRENLRWRKEDKIDSIKYEDFSDLASDYPQSIDTYDKAGQPMGVTDISQWDVRQAVLQGKGQRLHRYTIGLVENITGQVCERQQKGMNVTQVVVLLGAEGFNVIQQACPICLPLWIQFIIVIENYYPEWVDEFIVIDAPQAIQVVLTAVRPFFSRNTSNAIKVFGPNKNKWMAYLDNKISRSERRKAYGGTKPPLKY